MNAASSMKTYYTGKQRNRWLIAVAAVGVHICIGSVYAWSVFTEPLVDQMQWDLKDVQLTFSIAIFFLGISAAFLGHFLEKYGPKISGIFAAVFFGAGILGSGLAVELGSVYLLYLSYGVLGGIGLGIGYIAPVSTLIKWFPDKRGLATGLAVMGFGFAALISSTVIVKLISAVGIANTFYLMGLVYFIIILASSLYLAPPPAGWVPSGFKSSGKQENKKGVIAVPQLTAREAVSTKRFWYLWLMFFINVTCGIAVISLASPMAQEYVDLTPVAAATMVGIIGLFNGVGRIGWATFSDVVGRPVIFMIFFILQIIAFLLLPNATNAILFQALVFIIISCYGGGFATAPAFIGDLFGTRQLGIILGYILTAWAAAGIAGPLFAAWIRIITNSYDATLYSFAGILGVALLLSLLLKKEIGRQANAKPDIRQEAIPAGTPEAVDPKVRSIPFNKQ